MSRASHALLRHLAAVGVVGSHDNVAGVDCVLGRGSAVAEGTHELSRVGFSSIIFSQCIASPMPLLTSCQERLSRYDEHRGYLPIGLHKMEVWS